MCRFDRRQQEPGAPLAEVRQREALTAGIRGHQPSTQRRCDKDTPSLWMQVVSSEVNQQQRVPICCHLLYLCLAA